MKTLLIYPNHTIISPIEYKVLAIYRLSNLKMTQQIIQVNENATGNLLIL